VNVVVNGTFGNEVTTTAGVDVAVPGADVADAMIANDYLKFKIRPSVEDGIQRSRSRAKLKHQTFENERETRRSIILHC